MSPDFGTNVAIAMVGRDFWDEGTLVDVMAPDGVRRARVRAGSWL
jgi:dimethylsulfoniopropionate demethylase